MMNISYNSLFDAKLKQCMIVKRLYLNPMLRISDVATAIGTNRTYLSYYLNKQLCVSFYDFINHYRVMESCELLNGKSNVDLQEVAELSGFNSMSTFYRSFLKVMKITPVQYRNNQRIAVWLKKLLHWHLLLHFYKAISKTSRKFVN